MTGAVVMQFDRPGGACDRVGKFCAGPDVIDGQLLAADDPAGLANAGKTVGADPRLAKTFREFGAQEGNGAICLFLAVQSPLRGFDRIERRLDMGHVHRRHAASRE